MEKFQAELFGGSLDPDEPAGWELVLNIPGPPAPWKRAGRAPIKNKAGTVVNWRTYDTNTDFKERARASVSYWLAQERPEAPCPIYAADVAVQLLIVCVFPMPKSRRLKTSKRSREWKTGKRDDYDNLAKNVGDALQGLLWEDDGQIVWATVVKFVGEQGEPPYTKILARSLTDRDLRDWTWVGFRGESASDTEVETEP